MQRKLKTCSVCGKECYLFSHGRCKQCAAKDYKKPTSSGKVKPISDKRKKRLEKYKEIRDKFLKDNPVCMFPGCKSKEVECHHASGRSGDSLFNDLISLCRQHHIWVETHPKEAKELNLSKTRL